VLYSRDITTRKGNKMETDKEMLENELQRIDDQIATLSEQRKEILWAYNTKVLMAY